MAYVSISCTAHDVSIFTDSAVDLAQKLGRETRTMALEHRVSQEKATRWQNEMGMAV
jgi:hypothetical protein